MTVLDILSRLGLWRAGVWERPTLLESILTSPLQLLATLFYSFVLHLRGRPFVPPRDRPSIRVVCISDTHDKTLPVPDGDLLIHAGDLTNDGTVASIQKQVDWLDSQPHKHKVFVCGNHDSYFDPRSRRTEDKSSGQKLNFRSLRYLQRSSVTLEFKGGRKLCVFGAGDVPSCGSPNFAFQYAPDKAPWPNNIPLDTDILVTHTPPYSHLDLGLGCPKLLAELWRVKPRLHVFGHVHWGHGRQSIYFDECQRAYERIMARPKPGLLRDMLPHAGWVDALKLMAHGVQSVLFKWLMQGPGSNTGGLMVNAALTRGNTGQLGNSVQVVDL